MQALTNAGIIEEIESAIKELQIIQKEQSAIIHQVKESQLDIKRKAVKPLLHRSNRASSGLSKSLP